MGEIIYNRKGISSNPLDPVLQKKILIHEIGHWTIADHYGHTGQIEYDPETGNALVNIFFQPTENKLENLKQKIEVGLGGMVAETISGFQTGGFLLGDLPKIYEDVRTRNEILGKSFNYTRFGQLMMSEEYIEEQKNVHNIIMSRGGSKYLNESANDLIQRIHQSLR